jgi:hypothetical protein
LEPIVPTDKITPDVDDLANEWIRLQYLHRAGEDTGDAFWAFEVLDSMCDRDPNACLSVVQMIFQRDSSDFILANLAAGPVEDLLVRHGPSIIQSIEQLAAVDSRMAKIVSGIWRNTIDEDVWQRIRELQLKFSTQKVS